jgi:dTDP-4-amino-4,6-dideoxygalactose transaminase
MWISHKQVFAELRANGIGVNLHYIPVHMQPYYKTMGFKIGDFPESEKYYSEAISLPMFPNLTEDDQNRVVDVLASIVAKK